MINQNRIKELVKKYTEDMRCARRRLHEYPEISNEEERTAAYMAKTLRSFGVDVQEGVAGGYAVVGTLTGKQPGPTIALRADMDALSITEQTGLPFASQWEGKMLACGHDGHMAILLGAAKVLSELKDELAGTVLFICQPAEEKSPRGGAKGPGRSGRARRRRRRVRSSRMADAADGNDRRQSRADDGCLRPYPHRHPGEIQSCGHASQGRRRNRRGGAVYHGGPGHYQPADQPADPAVLTFGRISGGTRYNIVAGEVELEGTCRTYHTEAQDMVEAQLGNMLRGLDTMYGTASELHYERGYAAVVNSPQQADFVASVAADCFGRDALADVQEPAMTAEDFSGYLQACDGAFFWLGATKAGDAVYPLHNSRFAVDEGLPAYRRGTHGISGVPGYGEPIVLQISQIS